MCVFGDIVPGGTCKSVLFSAKMSRLALELPVKPWEAALFLSTRCGGVTGRVIVVVSNEKLGQLLLSYKVGKRKDGSIPEKVKLDSLKNCDIYFYFLSLSELFFAVTFYSSFCFLRSSRSFTSFDPSDL